MRSLKYKVHNFRPVESTDWINIEQLSCFIGVNESGKTNLLLPLWKFNPADNATKIDLLLDYPRDKYSEIESNDELKKEPFIETVFELENWEVNYLEKLYVGERENPEETNDNNTSTNTEKNKYGFTKYLLIKKDYNESFYIYTSNKNNEELSNELEKEVG